MIVLHHGYGCMDSIYSSEDEYQVLCRIFVDINGNQAKKNVDVRLIRMKRYTHPTSSDILTDF